MKNSGKKKNDLIKLATNELEKADLIEVLQFVMVMYLEFQDVIQSISKVIGNTWI